jgi:hypothetical protein
VPARIPAAPGRFRDDAVHFQTAWHDLLSAVSGAHPDLRFDLEGRPAAIAAIRGALPALEAELLDAVLEDVACELAATREALYLVAAAQAGR